MFFGFTEEELAVRDMVSRLFARESSTTAVREFIAHPEIRAAVRSGLAGQGLLGILEADGEAVEGVSIALLMSRAAGAALLPFPLTETLIMCMLLRNACGNEELGAKLESGEAIGSIAWDGSQLAIDTTPGGYRLNGRLPLVPFASSADHVLVACNDIEAADQPVVLALLDMSSPRLQVEQADPLDETCPVGTVTLDDYLIGGDAVVRRRDASPAQLWRIALQVGSLLAASDMVGAAEAAMGMAVDYTKQREQFGQPVASFQAIKHLAADGYLLVEGAKAATEYACWTLEQGESERAAAVAVAKAYASKAARKVASDSIQMHGGIGFTWESDIHLYFKRCVRGASTHGTSHEHYLHIADQVLGSPGVCLSAESERRLSTIGEPQKI